MQHSALGIPFVRKLNMRFWMCHESPGLKVSHRSPHVLRTAFPGGALAHRPLRVTGAWKCHRTPSIYSFLWNSEGATVCGC